MNRFFHLVLVIIFFCRIFDSYSQSVATTVDYNGAWAKGCCTVCNSDYWCLNTDLGGSECGTPTPCDSRTFTDPIPPGNIVTNITVNFYTAQCAGGSITATISGTTFPTAYEGSTGCLCSTFPCGITASTSMIYNCAYVYGGENTIQLCTGVDVCIDRAELIIDYTPAGGSGTWTWTGTVNSDWFVPCNWDKNTLPDLQSDVLIPGGTPYQPTISAMGASCNTLTVYSNNGAVVTITIRDALTINQ